MKKVLIAGTAVAALALAGCSAGVETVAESAQQASTSGSVIVEESADQPAEPDFYTPADTAVIDGDWEVRVIEVAKNADAAIAEANMFNEPPQHQYVLVTVEGTNVSDDFEDLFWMQVSILGSDNVVYKEASVVSPFDDTDVQTEAAPGGTVQAQFVVDIPASALEGGYLLLGYDRVKFALS